VYRWDSSLETGHEKIDNQHRQLFAIYNDLVEALTKGKSRDEISKTIEFLSSYVFIHFQMEEDLQRDSGYTDYPRHKRLHDEFKATANGLIKKFNEEGPSDEFIATITRVVGNWMFNHIKGDDFRMATFIKSKGAT